MIFRPGSVETALAEPIANVNDIPCNVEVAVGSQTLTVTEPARIWIHAHGSLRKNGSAAVEFGLWLRLRNAGDTATVAVSTTAWDATNTSGDTDAIFPLSTGGVLMSGDDTESGAPAFVAAPGTYTLQLVVEAIGPCAATLPDFGDNQGAGIGYLLTGTG